MVEETKKSGMKIGLKWTLSIAVLLILFLAMAYLIGQITGASIFSFSGPYELTKNDVFSIPNFDVTKISVFGVQLGDSYKIVMDKMGKPDVQQLHPPNTVNWEYNKKIETDETGLLIHMDSGIVTSITIKKPFNKYLTGESKVEGEKTDIYRKFGKPDRLEVKYPFTYYYYDNKGFDVIADAGKINGYTIRL